MMVIEKVDEVGKPAWIGLLVLSFILFWPVGLALLAFLIWSGRMGCGRSESRWDRREWKRRWKEGMREARGRWHYAPTSGNRAFDDYREETLRRLEDEQREFKEFLDRLRHAKDKAEFDQFMAEHGPRRPDDEAPASGA
jgi:Protein of unknown function (DUF2852)